MNYDQWYKLVQILCHPNIAEILTTCFTGFSLLAIVFSVFFYFREKRKQCGEKALDIAREYSTKIIANQNYIIEVLRKVNLDSVDREASKKMVDFTAEEMCGIYDRNKILSFNGDTIFKKFSNADLELLNTNRAIFTKPSSNIEINFENKSIENLRAILAIHYQDTVTQTLNYLEFLAMAVQTKLANEKIIYPSLHMTYLKCVKMLYVYIAHQNKSPSDKYFTNIISLHNHWENEYLKQCAKEKVLHEKLTKRLNMHQEKESKLIQNAINKAKKQKDKIVAKTPTI